MNSITQDRWVTETKGVFIKYCPALFNVNSSLGTNVTSRACVAILNGEKDINPMVFHLSKRQ